MSEKNILEEIAEKTRERIGKEKLQFPLKQLKILAEKAPQQPSFLEALKKPCLLYTSPSPRDRQKSRMPSSA